MRSLLVERRRAGRGSVVGLAALTLPACVVVAGAIGACSTVDLGSPPADVNACRPSEKFFAERIWPEFLAKDYGAHRCTNAGCHGQGSPREMVLAAPADGVPSLPLSPEWAAVYVAAANQMLCTDAAGSRLIGRPSSPDHGPGVRLIEADGMEAGLVKMWVAAR
jgi:hypothetical protein